MKNSKGFTLVEILLVVGVLGVLIAIIIAAVDPGEKLKQARDSTRRNNVTMLGKALYNYRVEKGSFVGYGTIVNPTWLNTLIASGDIKSMPPEIDSSGECMVNGPTPTTQYGYSMNKYCYYYSTTSGGNAARVITWVKVENSKDKSRCADQAFYIWDSLYGKSCIKCGTSSGTGTTYAGFTSGCAAD